jgi:predicted dehydrogenase
VTATTGVGLVGCGLIGRKRMMQLPGTARFVACFDTDRERAEALVAETEGKAAAEKTLDNLLSRDDIDLVVVATVHDALTEVASAAVEHGKHVLVEKPGSHRLDSLVALRDAARERDVVVRVGYNHRFHPALREVRTRVADGRYGGLMFLRARYGHGGRLGYEQEWRADKSRSGGGELIDQGSHLIDLTRYCFGDADLVFAELPTTFWAMDVEDNAFLALRPRGGGFAWLHASWTEWKNLFSFEVMLERAKLEVSGLGGSYGPERLTVYEMQPEMGPPPVSTTDFPTTDDSWRLELEDVLCAVEGGRADGASIDDAVATMSIIQEAYRS